MQPFEQAIAAACAAEEIPGAILLAVDRTGKFKYGRPFGKRSVRVEADQSALKLNSVMWIASCTKVVTSIAAMQCCEKGLLTLDGPIYAVLPELKDLPVIKGFDKEKGGQPILVPHKKTLTLRHLLTHSSGIAYDETHPKLVAWHTWHRTRPDFRTNAVEARYNYPLVFEPGDSWCYGAGIDWAGVAVERVSGLSLQKYFEQHIFAPVGARDIVFSSHLHTRPHMEARLADMSKRDPDIPAKVKRSNATLQYNRRGGCFGGLGLFASPPEYLRIIKGLLVAGDGDSSDNRPRLLSKESADEFFRPCLSPKAKAALNKLLLQDPEARQAMGNIPESVPKNWGLGGIVNEEDIPGGRAAGSMTWTGLPNLAWFADRKTGLCAFYASQVLPPGDPKVVELCSLFEKGVYGMYQTSRSKTSKL